MGPLSTLGTMLHCAPRPDLRAISLATENEDTSGEGGVLLPSGDERQRSPEPEHQAASAETRTTSKRRSAHKLSYVNQRIEALALLDRFVMEASDEHPAEAQSFWEAPLRNAAMELVYQFNDSFGARTLGCLDAPIGNPGGVQKRLQDLKELSAVERKALVELMSENERQFRQEKAEGEDEPTAAFAAAALKLRGAILSDREGAYVGQANLDGPLALNLLLAL